MKYALKIFADGDGFSIGEFRNGELFEAYNAEPYPTQGIAQQELDDFAQGCIARAYEDGETIPDMVRGKDGTWLCEC